MRRKLGTFEALALTLYFIPEECYEHVAMALMGNLVFQAWETLNGRTRLPPSLLPLLCDRPFLQQVFDAIDPWLGPLQSACFPGRLVLPPDAL